MKCKCKADLSEAKFIIDAFEQNLLKKFRLYCKDKFIITIGSVGLFVDISNELILYLRNILVCNGFQIQIKGEENCIEDIAIECFNISKNEKYSYKYQIQGLPSLVELSTRTNIPTIVLIIMKIVAQTIFKQKKIYKAIVLDLDETLWPGTIAEDGFDMLKKRMESNCSAPFRAFMNYVSALASELGIFVAICSKNDSSIVESFLDCLDEKQFPIKNQIDCSVINWNDKSENLEEIAKKLSILPESVIFIDDNQLVRDEVKMRLPNVFVPHWDNHYDLMSLLIAGCFFEVNELSITQRDKRRQYGIIQIERKQNYLPKLSIKYCCDDNHKEAIRLYAKSNQFKLSLENSEFKSGVESIYFELFRDNGESLGICSAITFCRMDNLIEVFNWAISCRYFEIGLEEFILLFIQKKFNISHVIFNFNKTDYNKKVIQLFDKYSSIFNIYDDKVELIFTSVSTKELNVNTNLKMIEDE